MSEYCLIVIFDTILIRLFALLCASATVKAHWLYSLLCRDTSLLRVTVNARLKEKTDVRAACCVCSIQRQRSELRHWRTHAGQD